MTKSDLRRGLTAALESFPAVRRRQESDALCGHLTALLASGRFTAVLTTLPTAEEPDLGPALRSWLRRGGQVALARTGPARSLGFHRVETLEGPWERHRFGIDEPPAALPRWEPGAPTLCLVPGLAFAPAQGFWTRLGRGGGYYDRWLEGFGAAVTAVGVGFSFQRVAGVPVEGHDAPLAGFLGPGGLEGLV